MFRVHSQAIDESLAGSGITINLRLIFIRITGAHFIFGKRCRLLYFLFLRFQVWQRKRGNDCVQHIVGRRNGNLHIDGTARAFYLLFLTVINNMKINKRLFSSKRDTHVAVDETVCALVHGTRRTSFDHQNTLKSIPSKK